jgi:hypothetical protein
VYVLGLQQLAQLWLSERGIGTEVQIDAALAIAKESTQAFSFEDQGCSAGSVPALVSFPPRWNGAWLALGTVIWGICG